MKVNKVLLSKEDYADLVCYKRHYETMQKNLIDLAYGLPDGEVRRELRRIINMSVFTACEPSKCVKEIGGER